MPRRDHTYWEISVDPNVLARFPAAEAEPPRDLQKQRMLDEAVAQLRTIIETSLTPRQREVVQAYSSMAEQRLRSPSSWASRSRSSAGISSEP
jgi:hypothetical protein